MEGGKGEREGGGEEEEPSMASQLLRRASKCPNQGIRREEKGPLHYLGGRTKEEGERGRGGRRSQPAIYRRDDPIPMPRKERRNSMASEEGPPLIKKSIGWSRERRAPNG